MMDPLLATVADGDTDTIPGEDLPAGEDRYRLEGQLGEGGLGKVWRAYDRRLGRYVALKEIHARREISSDVETQLRQEAMLTSRLEHPGIVPVHDLGRLPDGRLYYCMKLLEGRTLRERLEYFLALPPGGQRAAMRGELFAALINICHAIAFAHDRGVLHLDLKPENAFLGNFGEAQVLDWGIARVQRRSREIGEGPSRSARVGTPRYMSPEQIAGAADALCPASDVFALGMILLEIALAEQCRDLPALELSRLSDAPAEARKAAASLPDPLRSILRKALAESPRDRYPNAAELGREIQRFLLGERVLACREKLSVKLRRFLRRNRTPVLVLLTITLLAGAWGAERLVRLRDSALFASAATLEAQQQWKERDPTAALARLDAALQRLAGDALATGWRRELEATASSLRSWIRFDEALDKAKYFSVDPDRAAESTKYCQEARRHAATPLPAAFVTDRQTSERADKLRELQLLERWLVGGRRKVATKETPSDALSGTSDYFDGLAALWNGDDATAAAAFERRLARDPGDFWSMFFLANCQEHLGRSDLAALAYTAAIARRPDLPFLYQRRGNVFAAMGKTQEALRDYDRAGRSGGEDAAIAYNRALAHLRNGDLAAADSELKQVLARDPDHADAHLERGRLSLRRGNAKEGLASIERHMALRPDSIAGHTERGLYFASKASAAKAEADARAIEAVDPSAAGARWIRGALHAARNEWSAALRKFDAALAADPANPGLLDAKVCATLALGRFEDARNACDAILAKTPRDPMALANRAMASAGLGRTEDCQQDLLAVEPPASADDRLILVDRLARTAVLAGEAAPGPGTRPVVDAAVDKIRAMGDGLSEEWRRRALDLASLRRLTRNPRSQRRLAWN